jgi:hypothetical protein
VLVANRFLPQQYLIGPVLFPVYRFVLKIIALCYLVPWVLVWIGIISSTPAYRMNHAGWAHAALSAWGSLWGIALVAIGAATVVFAVLERVQAKSGFLKNWDPRKLPAVRNPNQIPRSGTVLELAAMLSFFVWWLFGMSSRLVLDRPDIRIQLTPAWDYFFWGYVVLSISIVALSYRNLVHPYWTVSRATMRLVNDCIGSALFCGMLKLNIVQEIWVRDVSPERLLVIANGLNFWMAKAFPVAAIVGVVIVAADLYRIIRVKSKGSSLAQGIAAAIV